MKNIISFLSVIFLFLIFAVGASAQLRYVAHLTGQQEAPNPNNSPGKGVCDILLNAAETQITVNCTYSGVSTPVTAAHIHDNGPAGVSGPVRFNFNYSGGTSGTIGPLTFNPTPAQVADLKAKRWYVNIHTSNIPGGEIRGQVKITTTVFDQDGDGRTDITVFRQSANSFYTLGSVNNSLLINPFGSGSSDIWLNNTGDFDGDGRGDFLLLKLDPTTSVATWSILQTATNTVRTVQWGTFTTAVGDTLAPADYDGDGKQDIAVFRRSNGVWYIIESSTGNPRYETFGAVNDFPSVGDYDGDGKADLTTVRVESGQRIWYIRQSSNGQVRRVAWGASATDGLNFFTPIDVDGDDKQDIMVTRSVGGQRLNIVLQSSNNQPYYLTWGKTTAPADTFLVGDYDGDGKTDFVARRDEGGTLAWYIYQSSTQTGRKVLWGVTGDQ